MFASAFIGPGPASPPPPDPPDAGGLKYAPPAPPPPKVPPPLGEGITGVVSKPAPPALPPGPGCPEPDAPPPAPHFAGLALTGHCCVPPGLPWGGEKEGVLPAPTVGECWPPPYPVPPDSADSLFPVGPDPPP